MRVSSNGLVVRVEYRDNVFGLFGALDAKAEGTRPPPAIEIEVADVANLLIPESRA